MEFKAEYIIAIVVFVILIAAFVPIVVDNIANGDDQRGCTTEGYPNECLDNDDGLVNWCSNETDGTTHCVLPLNILNVSTGLCTNSSGVGKFNTTPTSVCDSIGWANGIVPYADVGLSPVEVTLLGLVALFIVIAGVFTFVRGLTAK